MKKSLAFLGIWAAWILFSGLVSVGVVPIPKPLPQAKVPFHTLASELPKVHSQKLLSLATDLQEDWAGERLLATSA